MLDWYFILFLNLPIFIPIWWETVDFCPIKGEHFDGILMDWFLCCGWGRFCACTWPFHNHKLVLYSFPGFAHLNWPQVKNIKSEFFLIKLFLTHKWYYRMKEIVVCPEINPSRQYSGGKNPIPSYSWNQLLQTFSLECILSPLWNRKLTTTIKTVE